MELIDIASQMRGKIEELEELRAGLQSASLAKAKAIAEYEKSIALTTLKLKNGVMRTWEGQKVDQLQATIIPTTAKGMCWSELYQKELAEANYKSILVQLEVIQTELNGLQSLFRHLD